MRMILALKQQSSNANNVFDSTIGTDSSAGGKTPSEKNQTKSNNDFPTFGKEVDSSSLDINLGATSNPDPSKALPATQEGTTSTAQSDTAATVGSTQTESSTSSTGLRGIDGNPISTTNTETAQTSTPMQPSVAVDKPFDIGNLDPMWWWLLVPVILVPLLLFRFVMGTSSSYELSKYKYRGPSVQDPEAPNVRGRFKKRPSSHDAILSNDSSPTNDSVVSVENSSEVSDPDDDLSFLDEVEDQVFLDTPPSPVGKDLTDDSQTELSASLSGETDVESEKADSAPNLTVSNFSPESKTVNDQVDDSDVDFDFFMDDDDAQSDEVANSGTTEPSEENEDQFVEANANPDDAVMDSATEDSQFSTIEPASEHSNDAMADDDDELDLFGDDSGEEFTFEDDDELAVPAIAASGDNSDKPLVDAAAEIADSEEVAIEPEPEHSMVVADNGDDELDLFDDSDDEFTFEDDDEEVPAIAASSDSSDEPSVQAAEEIADSDDAEMEPVEESADHTMETVVAATASAAVVAAGAGKGGSWMKRLFGGRKAKQRAVKQEEVDESAISATAVTTLEDEVEDADLVDSASIEDLGVAQMDVEDVTPPVSVGVAESSELDFSDSGDAFSLDGDDSSDGLFDDDSDADYQFDAEEVVAPVANSKSDSSIDAVSAIDKELTDSIGIFDGNAEDFDASSEEIDALSEDIDILPEEVDDQEIALAATESLSISEPVEQIESIQIESMSSKTESEDIEDLPLETASSDADFEFKPVAHPAGSDDLPLLEDQMLDDIVSSESDSENAHQILPMGVVGRSGGRIEDTASGREDAEGIVADTMLPPASDSSSEELTKLRLRIEELESKNLSVEAERSSLESELEEAREASVKDKEALENEEKLANELKQAEEDKLADEKKLAEENKLADEQKIADMEQQLKDVQQAKQELEDQLAAEAEAKRHAAEEAEQARADAETARVDAETAREAADKAAAEAAEFREQAEQAVAAMEEAEQSAQSQDSSSAGMLGGSLLAAAGGAVAGAAMTGESGESQSEDDPFRLEPEQVKVMLKKLKNERKKRLKTKEYFLAADAKRREVASTLQQVSGELENLKLEFQKVSDASNDNASDQSVQALKDKLDAAEDALKKNNL